MLTSQLYVDLKRFPSGTFYTRNCEEWVVYKYNTFETGYLNFCTVQKRGCNDLVCIEFVFWFRRNTGLMWDWSAISKYGEEKRLLICNFNYLPNIYKVVFLLNCKLRRYEALHFCRYVIQCVNYITWKQVLKIIKLLLVFCNLASTTNFLIDYKLKIPSTKNTKTIIK